MHVRMPIRSGLGPGFVKSKYFRVSKIYQNPPGLDWIGFFRVSKIKNNVVKFNITGTCKNINYIYTITNIKKIKLISSQT